VNRVVHSMVITKHDSSCKNRGNSCIFCKKWVILEYTFSLLGPPEAYKQFNLSTTFPVYSQIVCEVFSVQWGIVQNNTIS